MKLKEEVFKIYVLEDDEWYNKLLTHALSLNPDFFVRSFFKAEDFFKSLVDKPAIVTIDYRLPDANGEQVLEKIKSISPDTEVIVVSEQENIETAVNLLRLGAYDYLVKEKNIRDRLLSIVNNIRKNDSLKKKITTLETELKKKHDFSNSILGSSEAMSKVNHLIEKSLQVNILVTITGETGTGKEVVAKAIHYNSDRKNKPFIAVNVAAIPSDLVESELFGHEKGAFTGALTRRIGKFEEASGGTLFLDEIGEMELSFQAKLLRALQEREIVRVGSNSPVKFDCRIIVATHRNLLELVKQNKFREDLYFRLYGLTIDLPPLRERGKDVLILAQHFIANFCKENKMPAKTLSESAQKKLMSYRFPGNVRELKSTVELAVVMSPDTTIQPDTINLASTDSMSAMLAEEMTMKDYELQIIKSFLKKYDNNMKLVAEKLDIGLSTLYRLLKENKEE
ncbi:MAG TPA: sigma-54 dependent transcriptional regulator [Bacteroidia bacterium]|nr:sigma-54 dependent transcriptional regulator [Bacteroidia bacterium]HRH08520.1 sigma-54 dependent transcriptional regulator [Bacteroidia bacterium]HRH62297.1 sigma-54 dependent transcriptional regulator [Bacteroidia bacterium]